MKFQLKNIIAVIVIALSLSCCTTENDNVSDELSGFTKFKEITNATHTIELYSQMTVQQGYNTIAMKIKDNKTGFYIKDAAITWLPLMHMSMMSHSCPNSTVSKMGTSGTVYSGTIVFQMASNSTEYWDLKIDYSSNATSYTVTSVLNVPASARQRVTTFTGSDNVNYVLAYAEPTNPKVAVNDIAVSLYKMNSMTSFSTVDNYTIKIDPRMPSMGNHGSPNNVDLTQSTDNLYHGKMALTMTGYWKINLQILNASSTVLKGEAISDTVPSSSLYLEVEF